MTPFRRILVPTDFSASADRAFSLALQVARAGSSEIHLMHDVEVPTATITGANIVKEEIEKARTEARRQMDDLIASQRASDVVTEQVIQKSTDPVRSIPLYAKENGIDLVVMGAHGHHSLKEKLLGSRAERVLREAPCPVITVAPDDRAAGQPPGHLLVPIDFSEASVASLRLAHGFAQAFDARLSLLHAADWGEEENSREKLRGLYEREIGTDGSVKVYVSEESPADAILTAADEAGADLIVMTTHGRKGVKRVLMGNVVDGVVPKAPCPVMTIPASAEDEAD